MLAVILVVAGIGFKIAAVPFHMWAPDVYEGAPTPVTAFLSVGSKAASFAMLLRIFVEGLPSMSADWRLLFEVLAIVTMTVGNLAALTQTNLKRMLAYSSIAHAGYLLIGVVAGTPRGITAMLDLPAGLRLHAARRLRGHRAAAPAATCVGDELKDFSGLTFRNPFAAFAMLLFMLSLGGIPPTAGFMGKFWLFSAAIDARLLLAGGHRRAEQRDLALLLRPHRRLHVSEEGDDRIGADDQPGAGGRARRRGGRRRSCSASIRGCCSRWPRRRRGRSGAARRVLTARGCRLSRARDRRLRRSRLVNFFTRYGILPGQRGAVQAIMVAFAMADKMTASLRSHVRRRRFQENVRSRPDRRPAPATR